jgi:hypothetical protein
MSSVPSADGVPPNGGVTPEALIPMRRLAYAVLPPSTSRRRRARTADTLAHRALLQGASRRTARAHLIREVLHAARHGGWVPTQVTRLVEPSTSTDRAVDSALGAMVPATRAAFALLHLEGLTAAQAIAVLELAGVQEAQIAVSLAERSPLDPEALKSLVVRVPTTAVSPRLAAAGALGLVLAIGAPVLAFSAFGGHDPAPAPVATQTAFDSDREAAVQAAKTALRGAEEKKLTDAAIAKSERQLKRALSRLNHQIHRHGVSHRELERLKDLRSDVEAKLQDLQHLAAGT